MGERDGPDDPLKKRLLEDAERLLREAGRLRQEARRTPTGIERERLLRKARQLETAARMQEWLSSPGLRAPD
ncbi:hypothetical protein V1290_005409 [Bradyrhizobium sp. AZCC 1578]